MVTLLTRILTPVVVLAAVWSAPPQGEQVTFTGQVADDRTGAPLASVQVQIEDTPFGTVTDARGEYILEAPRSALPRGGARLIARLIGYEVEAVALEPSRYSAQSTVRVDIRLRPTSVGLSEVVISGDVTIVPTTFSDEAVRGAVHPRVEGHPFHLPPDFDREQYAYIQENEFRSARGNPLSTFAIDVDRASYSNVRRFLSERRLPPVDAVQIEEMVNYFPYDYALPGGEHPLAVTTELGRAPWNEHHQLLRVGLASRPVDLADMPPNNLVFLVDVSGSMRPWNRLPLVKRSLRLLVDELRPIDRVAIVVYAGTTGIVLESTPGSEKQRILSAIDALEAGGYTAGGAGLRLAYRVARENFIEEGNNRVILATDGDFNVGESSDAAMIRLIQELKGEGTFLTILGYGMRNLQFEKMQLLAHHGNGNHAYIDSLEEARKVLVHEMGGTLLTVAQDVKIQVEFNPARVHAYRLIGYENRLLQSEDFNDDAKDGGALGAGHRVTALYEIIPVGSGSEVQVRGTDPLRYQSTGGLSGAGGAEELAFVRVRYKEPRGEESRLVEHPVEREVGSPSEDYTFAAAVAGFGMLLRGSEHRGSITAEQVLAMAADGMGEDPDGYRRGFVQMVETYRGITALADGGRD